MSRHAQPIRVLVIVALAGATACDRSGPLPPTMQVQRIVRDLDPELTEPQRVLADPGDALRGDGARTSAVVPPGGRIRLGLAVPEHAALSFGIAVTGDKARHADRAGLRFAVTVDGRQRFERIVNPAATRHDRRWFDERVDLAAEAGKTIDLTLAVDATSAGVVPAGDAVWSRLRLVQTTEIPRQPARHDAPNLLVLVVDTLRADAVGLYGGEGAATPALDGLGARGTVFATAISQSSWTLPSVATLMTGLVPRQHQAIGEVERVGGRGQARWGYLAESVTTWAELAEHDGIATFGASANPLVSTGTNVAQGFETFVELPWDPDGRDWAQADAVNDAFLAWLPRRTGYRFAAYLHYMEPHDPYTPPIAPAAPSGVRPHVSAGWVRDLADKINWGGGAPLSPDEVMHLRQRYLAEVTAWDQALARLLRALEDARLADDTVVVVTADHGEEFQEHGRLTHGSHVYEESIRVPLVVAGPGIPRSRRADLVQGIDLMPTLVRLLGTTPDASLAGHDLLGTPSERPAFVETASGIAPDGRAVEIIAVRTARWKLIQTPALSRIELYDLASDPLEHTDQFASAAIAPVLAADLERWRSTTAPVATAAPGDPAFAAKLRALGYAR